MGSSAHLLDVAGKTATPAEAGKRGKAVKFSQNGELVRQGSSHQLPFPAGDYFWLVAVISLSTSPRGHVTFLPFCPTAFPKPDPCPPTFPSNEGWSFPTSKWPFSFNSVSERRALNFGKWGEERRGLAPKKTELIPTASLTNLMR